MEYKFSDNASLGFTLLHLNERPGGISRYSIGSEPIKNTKYGFDLSIFQESKLLTKIVDFVPLLGTKEIVIFLVTQTPWVTWFQSPGKTQVRFQWPEW